MRTYHVALAKVLDICLRAGLTPSVNMNLPTILPTVPCSWMCLAEVSNRSLLSKLNWTVLGLSQRKGNKAIVSRRLENLDLTVALSVFLRGMLTEGLFQSGVTNSWLALFDNLLQTTTSRNIGERAVLAESSVTPQPYEVLRLQQSSGGMHDTAVALPGSTGHSLPSLSHRTLSSSKSSPSLIPAQMKAFPTCVATPPSHALKS